MLIFQYSFFYFWLYDFFGMKFRWNKKVLASYSCSSLMIAVDLKVFVSSGV